MNTPTRDRSDVQKAIGEDDPTSDFCEGDVGLRAGGQVVCRCVQVHGARQVVRLCAARQVVRLCAGVGWVKPEKVHAGAQCRAGARCSGLGKA